MKFWFGLVSCLLLMQAQAAQQKPVVAVYADWKYPDFNAEHLPWSQFSHLAIASVYPQAAGTLESTMVDQFIAPLVKAAHQQNKKVLLSVGGAGEGSKAFHQIMQNQQTTKMFIHNISQYARQHQLDGIDIDWEYWTYQHQLQRGGRDPVESQQLIDLLKALRAELPPPFLLSVDIVAGDWLGAQYGSEIQQHVDYVNLMAFDFTGGWPSSLIAHHADYDTFVRAIKHTLAKGFDRQKLLVGLPAYGIEFVDGGKTQTRQVAYRDIVASSGANPAILQKGKFGHVYFENKFLFAKKARYLARKNLAGYFVFDIAADHPDPEFSLMTAARRYITPVVHHSSR